LQTSCLSMTVGSETTGIGEQDENGLPV